MNTNLLLNENEISDIYYGIYNSSPSKSKSISKSISKYEFGDKSISKYKFGYENLNIFKIIILLIIYTISISRIYIKINKLKEDNKRYNLSMIISFIIFLLIILSCYVYTITLDLEFVLICNIFIFIIIENRIKI